MSTNHTLFIFDTAIGCRSADLHLVRVLAVQVVIFLFSWVAEVKYSRKYIKNKSPAVTDSGEGKVDLVGRKRSQAPIFARTKGYSRQPRLHKYGAPVTAYNAGSW